MSLGGPLTRLSAPHLFVDFIRRHGYHPRSNAHSNALMGFIAGDLARNCAAIQSAAENGDLVYAINHDVNFANETWNIDLAFGPPSDARIAVAPGTIRQVSTDNPPSAVRIAIEAKAIMTKHTGARKNRRRDIGAFRDYMENFEPKAIRGAVAVVNMAQRFQSPLGSRKLNIHSNIERIVSEIGTIYRNVPLRPIGGRQGTVDANCIIVIDYDGVNQAAASLVSRRPAPRPNDPISYPTFIQRLCDAYSDVWPSERGPPATIPPLARTPIADSGR